MSNFEKFKEELSGKEKFYSFIVPLWKEKLLTKHMNMFLMFGKKWNENVERLSRLVFKIERFIINWCVWKIYK